MCWNEAYTRSRITSVWDLERVSGLYLYLVGVGGDGAMWEIDVDDVCEDSSKVRRER